MNPHDDFLRCGMGRGRLPLCAQDKPPDGYPVTAVVQQGYDEADLNRAVQAYKFFYPTVSGAAIVKGNEEIGVVPNKVFGILDYAPEHVVFTANSDTPYGPLLLDFGVGPLVVELQPGPLIVCSMDVNQRWVADMGLPGPDAGIRINGPAGVLSLVTAEARFR